jgi:hypothetical protein
MGGSDRGRSLLCANGRRVCELADDHCGTNETAHRHGHRTRRWKEHIDALSEEKAATPYRSRSSLSTHRDRPTRYPDCLEQLLGADRQTMRPAADRRQSGEDGRPTNSRPRTGPSVGARRLSVEYRCRTANGVGLKLSTWSYATSAWLSVHDPHLVLGTLASSALAPCRCQHCGTVSTVAPLLSWLCRKECGQVA